jgi:general secretion pathway protein D
MRKSLPQWSRIGETKISPACGANRQISEPGEYSISIRTVTAGKILRVMLAAFLAMALSAPAHSDQASAAYSRGLRAENESHTDAAFEAYKIAHQLKPKDTKFLVAYLRTRSIAAQDHVRKGQILRDNFKLQEAAAEFQQAFMIDDTNYAAQQEMQVTMELIKQKAREAAAAAGPKPLTPLQIKAAQTEGPVELEPISNTPLTLRMTTTTDNVYKTIGKLAGINVLFDMDYKPQRITIELDEVPLLDALRMVALESKTFWRPISNKAIFVSADSRRKEYEDSVMTTFYVRNAGTPAELQEIVGTLKGILEISKVQVNPTHSSITLRGTPDQMVLAQKLISDLDKPKAEVVIDIAVLEVSSDRMRTLGTTIPTSTSIALQAAAGGVGTVNFGALNGGKFVVTVPSSASFSFLMSDSNTKVLQNPEIRVLDQGKASLKIGDRIPIATGSFSAVGGSSGGGISPIVNTQFQYLDVGVNIDVTPHVLSDREVDLKMVLEVSSVTGSTNIGGISQPTIGQRHIEHEMRVADGEVNLVGGILEDSETQSLGGYPWIGELPILKYLFSQENKDRRKTEIVFAIIPHIVRTDDATEENLRLIDIGTGTTIDLRRADQSKKTGSSSDPDAKPATPGNLPPKNSGATVAPSAPANPARR